MEVLRSKTGASVPTIRTESFNIVKYTMKYYSLEYNGTIPISEEDEELITVSGNVGQSGGQVILAGSGEHEWLLMGEKESVWFSAFSGAIIFKDDYIIFANRDRRFILKEVDKRGHHSMAILELLLDARFLVRVSNFFADRGIEIAVETVGESVLFIDCEAIQGLPEDWKISCVDTSWEPAYLKRHDRDLPTEELAALSSHRIQVDYGRFVNVPQDVLLQLTSATSQPRSSSSVREVGITLTGERTILVATRLYDILMYRVGTLSTICIAAKGLNPEESRNPCRTRRWKSELEAVAAFQALQLEALVNENAWEIRGEWLRGDAEGTKTSVTWISMELGSRECSRMYDSKTVATVNTLFLVGVGLVVLVLLAGTALSLVYQHLGRRGPESCRSVSLESTRKSLAMSNQTKYNCGLTPRTHPLTAVLVTREHTCHLETFFPAEDDGRLYLEAGKAGLLLLGRRTNTIESRRSGTLVAARAAAGRVIGGGRGGGRDETRGAQLESGRSDGKLSPYEITEENR